MRSLRMRYPRDRSPSARLRRVTARPAPRGSPLDPAPPGPGATGPRVRARRGPGERRSGPRLKFLTTGTVNDPGPPWWVTGYDADGDEFHGHARRVGPTGPRASGTTDLIFEVPAGTPLRRVLLSDARVDVG